MDMVLIILLWLNLFFTIPAIAVYVNKKGNFEEIKLWELLVFVLGIIGLFFFMILNLKLFKRNKRGE